MEENHFGLSTDTADSMSVESILAEYNLESKIEISNINAEREAAQLIKSESEEIDAPGIAELDRSSSDNFPTDNPFSLDSKLSFPTVAVTDSADKPDPPTMQHFSSNNEDFPSTSSPILEDTLSKEPSEDEKSDFSEISDNSDGSKYADRGDYDQNEEDLHSSAQKPDLKERLILPLIGLIAHSAAKREKRRIEAQAKRDALPKVLPPELEPSKAAMLYAQQSEALKLRCLFASGLTAVLVYLSYGFPAPGLLGSNQAIRALVCLVFELSVMLVGLDIFTNGIVSIIRKKPGAESLISLSAIITAIGAIYIAVSGNQELGLPFCGVSALSMTFALWGEKLSCDNFAISFYTAAQAKDPVLIVSKPGIDDEGCALAKVKRPVTGFVRTAETSDIFEDIYKLFAPIFIVASVVLSLFCFLASTSNPNFIHTLGASMSISASLSAFHGFSLPFSVTAKRLARSGVAIAGYSGCAEIGGKRRVIITDADIFPPRAVSIGDISMTEGVSPQKTISYTSSMISAAGLGIAPVFTQLMQKNGCVTQKVEDFACHEGGGIMARINGELVYVGTESFMRLMGVRIPKNSASRTSIYTAINDVLAGYFLMVYTAVASVQRALVSLLSGAGEPVFAIRDFNITPMLLKQKFRLPAGNYDFPSFADRYFISASEFEKDGIVTAMFSRGGLNSVAGLAKRGRRLYLSIRFAAALSIIGSIIGMALILALCWNASYASASCANIITYMLLWVVPVLVISYGLRR